MAIDESTVETIRQFAVDIEAKESELKIINDMLKDMAESLPESAELKDLAEEMAEVRERFRNHLMQKPQYNDIAEKKARLVEDIKDIKDVLSSYILEYYADTKEFQIELNPENGDAREVIVSGKLGKSQKYQPSLFSELKE